LPISRFSRLALRHLAGMVNLPAKIPFPVKCLRAVTQGYLILFDYQEMKHNNMKFICFSFIKTLRYSIEYCCFYKTRGSEEKTVINQSKKYELTLRFRLEVTTPNAYIQLLMGFLPARFSATLHKGEQNEE
jgi:hypothetical protein